MAEGIDIDDATLALIRQHHERLEALQPKIEGATTYTTQRELLGQFHSELLRQEAILSETPGLEQHVRRIRTQRERFERRYDF